MTDLERFEAAWQAQGRDLYESFKACAWEWWQAALVAASKPAGPLTDTQIARFATDARQHEAMEFSGSTKVASHDNVVWAIRRALLDASPAASFQERVQPWMVACFGVDIAADGIERNHRFFEEATELVQACGMTASEAHQLVDYTFGRAIGEPTQEVGGVMVTLAALCLANGLDMHAAGETELARIWTKVDAIRAKQAAKPKHSPLPAAPAQSGEAIYQIRTLRAGNSAWIDADKATAEHLKSNGAHEMRIVYAAPQPASGGAK